MINEVKGNTIIVSDLHLTETQVSNDNSLWMLYKREKYSIDNDFANFLQWLNATIDGKIELILNGDTFDFDTVLSVPNDNVDWLSKRRGLGSEEWMSLFKIDVIIKDHPVWFGALKAFIKNGNKVIFVVGNHDIELYWPSVQKRICDILENNNIKFCNSFYISEQDTFISHGHQFDSNCVVVDTINPLIKINNKIKMRIPFGDLATRYVLNGIGWLNPHSQNNYIKNTYEYIKLFIRYWRMQPLMLWSWFWGACVAFAMSLRDHWKYPMIDPLLLEEKMADIAECSNATPSMVRRLKAMQVPSSCNNPITIFRELWLDRAILLLWLVLFAWQVMLHINIAVHINMIWFIIPFLILLPTLMIYNSSIKPKVFESPLLTKEQSEYILKITGVERIILSHTHELEHIIDGVEYINTGSWAPAFSDAECKNKINKQIFVWISPKNDKRHSSIYAWSHTCIN